VGGWGETSRLVWLLLWDHLWRFLFLVLRRGLVLWRPCLLYLFHQFLIEIEMYLVSLLLLLLLRGRMQDILLEHRRHTKKWSTFGDLHVWDTSLSNWAPRYSWIERNRFWTDWMGRIGCRVLVRRNRDMSLWWESTQGGIKSGWWPRRARWWSDVQKGKPLTLSH